MGRHSLPTRAARKMAALRKTKSGGHNGGRPRIDAPRCPCAVMTLRRAETRGRSAEHLPVCSFYPA